jgi:hypothetical protein
MQPQADTGKIFSGVTKDAASSRYRKDILGVTKDAASSGYRKDI